jgi:hypothetical protein
MAGTLHMEICGTAAIVADAITGGAFVCDGGAHKGRRNRAMPEQFKRQVHVYLDVAPIDRAQLLGPARRLDDAHPHRVLRARRQRHAARWRRQRRRPGRSRVGGLMAVPNLDLPDSVMDFAPVAIKWDTEEADTADRRGAARVRGQAPHRRNSIGA